MNTVQQIAQILSEFFDKDVYKITLWLTTPNPQLGGTTPASMIMFGREKKLLKIMQALRRGALP